VSDLFYLQDSRTYVGNDMMFWAKDGKGYTTDMRLAEVYTKDEAQRRHNHRASDIPWPKDYIDARTRPAVDMQHVNRAAALAGTGIELAKPRPKTPDTINCTGCGRFMGGTQRYLQDCEHCGTNNRP
jgi:hypothetical protein